MSATAPAPRTDSRTRVTHPSLLETGSALLKVLVVGMFLTTFLMQPFRIPSGSMEPALLVGDCVLVSKAEMGAAPGGAWGWLEGRLLPPAAIQRGEMVVFHFPPDPRRDLVKRVVALPGDHLQMHNGRVYLNGSPLSEPYAMYTPAPPEVFRDEFPNLREADPNTDPHWWMTLRRSVGKNGELTVPPGMYFVLGDNRNNSEDSRYWGFVPEALMIGRPAVVYFAIPNGAEAPEGGPLERLRWVLGWVRQRVGVLR